MKGKHWSAIWRNDAAVEHFFSFNTTVRRLWCRRNYFFAGCTLYLSQFLEPVYTFILKHSSHSCCYTVFLSWNIQNLIKFMFSLLRVFSTFLIYQISNSTDIIADMSKELFIDWLSIIFYNCGITPPNHLDMDTEPEYISANPILSCPMCRSDIRQNRQTGGKNTLEMGDSWCLGSP